MLIAAMQRHLATSANNETVVAVRQGATYNDAARLGAGVVRITSTIHISI